MPGGCRDARSGSTVAIRSEQGAESAGPIAGAKTGGGASSRSEASRAGASASVRTAPTCAGSNASQRRSANRPLAPTMKPVSAPVTPNAPAASAESHGPFKPGGNPPIKTVAAAPGAKGLRRLKPGAANSKLIPTTANPKAAAEAKAEAPKDVPRDIPKAGRAAGDCCR